MNLIEQIEIFLCDLFDLHRLNNRVEAVDKVFRDTIQIKVASIDENGFFFYKYQHYELRDSVKPAYLFCVYKKTANDKISILGLKKVSWDDVDEMLNFENSNELTINKIFRMSDLKPMFTILADW